MQHVCTELFATSLACDSSSPLSQVDPSASSWRKTLLPAPAGPTRATPKRTLRVYDSEQATGVIGAEVALHHTNSGKHSILPSPVAAVGQVAQPTLRLHYGVKRCTKKTCDTTMHG